MGKALIRIFAFFRKEIVEIFRQPRLLLSLILGPFLILLLFGVGYRNQARAVTALFVIAPDNSVAPQVVEYAREIGPHLIYAGMTNDVNVAIARMQRGEVDIVVQVPGDIEDTLNEDKQAVFVLYHNEIDPAQVEYVHYLGRNYIDEVNRRVLSSYAGEAQNETGDVLQDVRMARENASAMRAALETGNLAAARSEQQQLQRNVGSASGSVETRMLFAAMLAQQLGSPSGDDEDLSGVMRRLQDIQGRGSNSGDLNDDDEFDAEIEELRQTEEDLGEVEAQLAEFRSISPFVLVRPFVSETKSVAPISDLEPAVFFTPGVIALVVQHLAVTFGSLSIIRERLSGTMDLFRVSPISAGETLLGKYISYIFLSALMAAALSALLYFVLKVPILGGWLNFSMVMLALIFCSLGLGFVISMLAANESQAVQLAMLTLLISVFFSGMFLDLRYLWTPVQTISWLTPATYAKLLFEDVMLRGVGITPLYILGLIFLGLLFFLITLKALRREMKLG